MKNTSYVNTITITITSTIIIITRTKRLMNAGGDWKSWTMFGAWGGQSTSTIKWMMEMMIMKLMEMIMSRWMMKITLMMVVKERGF